MESRELYVHGAYKVHTYEQRHYDLDSASLRIVVAPLQVCGGTNMRVRRTTILLISLTLIGFLVPLILVEAPPFPS